MPTFPYVFSPGTATNAEEFSENVFNPADPPVSFDEINGYLDDDNITDVNTIDYNCITPREVSTAKEVGATINIDYFSKYSFVDKEVSEILVTKDYQLIPGACINYHLSFVPTALIFTWSLTYLFYGASMCPPNPIPDEDQARFRFFIDNSYKTGQQLRVGLCFQ